MRNETKKTALPKLRFPEFRDAGEWEEKKLREVCEVNPSATDLPETFVYVDLESVERGVLLQKKIISKKGAPSRAQRLLQNKDAIFQMVRPYQRNNYFFQSTDSIAYVASTGYAQLRAYESSEYLFQCLHHNDFVKKVLEKCTGSSYPAINSSDLARIPIVIPSLPEQQKIAATLSSLDDLLTAQSAQLAALQAHKRGLMQALFPAEGETVPKLRFPEFQGVGEWEEKTLGDVAKFGSGGTPSKDKPEYWDGDTPWISASSMHNYVIDESELYITDAAKKAGAAIVGKGTLLLLVRGSMLFKRIPMGIAAREVAFNQDVKSLYLDKKITTLYLLYYLVSAEKLLLGKVTATGIGAGKLDTADLKQFPICIPSPAEQQKIIDCLSVLDQRISAQTEKIEALQRHKKGLMQHLFPAAA